MPIRNDSRAESRESRGADPMADHKRRSRWRLFGSFILIGTVALVAPVFLEDEARNLSNDLLIEMPSRAVAVKPEAAADAADTSDREVIREPLKGPDRDVTKESIKEPLKEPTKEALKEPVKEPVKEPTKQALKEAPKQPAKELTPAPRPLPLKPPADLAAVASVYYVQVGAYASLEAAGSMKKQLESLGQAVLIQAVQVAGGADRYRVRVGPFKSRPQAEEMMGRIKEKGYDAVIVNPV